MSRSYKELQAKQAGCDGKQALSKTMADQIAKQSQGNVQPYRCRFCGNWHVGSHIRKVRK